MTDPIQARLSINGISTGGTIKEIKPQQAGPSIRPGDGQDQVVVAAQGKTYLVEGEQLNLSGLERTKALPQIELFVEGKSLNAKIQRVDDEATGIAEKLSRYFEPPVGWGGASQVQGTVDELNDLLGNRDGLWNNEDQLAGTIGDFDDRNPAALKAKTALAAKGDIQEAIERLQTYRRGREMSWGEPVTQLDLGQLKDGELFAAQKTLSLTRMERKPSDVTEGFVSAKGSVNNQKIADREIFWQRFKPQGEPSGKVIMVAPGFLQNGRNFYEQVQLLNKQGHDVIIMDQQWSGQTKGGKEGGVDRGYGITRDVAVMAAHAQQVLDKEYAQNPNKELILMGTSLGGGPGVLGALTMNENNLLKIEGPQMPKQAKAVLQGPFMGATDNINNKVFSAASKIPLAKNVPLPAIGLPILTEDPMAAQKIAQGAVLEDAQARLQAMTAINADMNDMLKLIEQGKGPKNSIELIHSERDPLASSTHSKQVAKWLPNIQLQVIDSGDHVLEQSKHEQGLAVDAIERLEKR